MQADMQKKSGAIEEILDYIDVQLSPKQVNDLLEAAGGDAGKVRKAYDLSRNQKDIHNLVAWLVSDKSPS